MLRPLVEQLTTARRDALEQRSEPGHLLGVLLTKDLARPARVARDGALGLGLEPTQLAPGEAGERELRTSRIEIERRGQQRRDRRVELEREIVRLAQRRRGLSLRLGQSPLERGYARAVMGTAARRAEGRWRRPGRWLASHQGRWRRRRSTALS